MPKVSVIPRAGNSRNPGKRFSWSAVLPMTLPVPHVDRSVHLQGAGAVASASAVVDVGGSSGGPVRDVQVHVNGLPAAPKGGYYELWMQDGSSEPTGLVAFDTSGTGSVVANTTIPKDMPWTKCWVTLERADGSRTTVLTLA